MDVSPDDTTWMAGGVRLRAAPGVGVGGVLVRVAKAGAVIGRDEHKAAGGEFYWVRAHPAGGMVVGGRLSDVKGAPRAWLVRLDGAAKVQWQRVLTLGEYTHLRGLAVSADGLIGASISAKQGFEEYGRIEIRTPTGGLAAARDFHSGVRFRFDYQAFGAGPHGWWAQGDRRINNAVSRWYGRFSKWLHTSCGEAGSCYEKTIKSCSDGDPCTFGACSAAKGCAVGAVDCDDGSACTDDSCDKAKGCVYTPNGKPCG